MVGSGLRTIVLALTAFAVSVQAEVVRVEVKSRVDILAGKSFGQAGAYAKMCGKVHLTQDPGNRSNQIITDIDKAPKNPSGKVEFSSDFYLIKPKNLERGNGTLLYEVCNRGGKAMIGFFNLASRS